MGAGRSSAVGGTRPWNRRALEGARLQEAAGAGAALVRRSAPDSPEQLNGRWEGGVRGVGMGGRTR